jgi:hypothetical protein
MSRLQGLVMEMGMEKEEGERVGGHLNLVAGCELVGSQRMETGEQHVHGLCTGLWLLACQQQLVCLWLVGWLVGLLGVSSLTL